MNRRRAAIIKQPKTLFNLQFPAACRVSDNSNFVNLANVNSNRYGAKNDKKSYCRTACLLRGGS